VQSFSFALCSEAGSGPNSKGIEDKGMIFCLTLRTNESILFLVVHLDFDELQISKRI